jgi:hypothetical protein
MLEHWSRRTVQHFLRECLDVESMTGGITYVAPVPFHRIRMLIEQRRDHVVREANSRLPKETLITRGLLHLDVSTHISKCMLEFFPIQETRPVTGIKYDKEVTGDFWAGT